MTLRVNQPLEEFILEKKAECHTLFFVPHVFPEVSSFFRGASISHLTPLRCEAKREALILQPEG